MCLPEQKLHFSETTLTTRYIHIFGCDNFLLPKVWKMSHHTFCYHKFWFCVPGLITMPIFMNQSNCWRIYQTKRRVFWKKKFQKRDLYVWYYPWVKVLQNMRHSYIMWTKQCTRTCLKNLKKLIFSAIFTIFCSSGKKDKNSEAHGLLASVHVFGSSIWISLPDQFAKNCQCTVDDFAVAEVLI